MNVQDYEQLTLFQGDSPVSRLVLPGSEEARRMTATSGRKCLELYRKSGPLGSLVRMLLESSQWRSTRCYLTWKASATPAKRLLFRLVPSMPHTDGIGAQLWPTPTAGRPDQGMSPSQEKRHTPNLAQAVELWPTPSASDCGRTAINPVMTSNGTIRHKGKSGKQSYARLDSVAALFPTPTARDFKSPDMNPDSKRFSQKTELPSAVGGAAQPGLGGMVDGLPRWLDEPVNIPRIATGVKDRANRLKCLGNAVVPQQFYQIFRAIAEIERTENHDR